MSTAARTARRAGLAAAACGVLALVTPAPALALNVDDLLGAIELIGGNYCPKGSVEAAGQMLGVAQNRALFALLSTTYGGDGRSSFRLPDLRGKEPVPGSRYCVVTDGLFPTRD